MENQTKLKEKFNLENIEINKLLDKQIKPEEELDTEGDRKTKKSHEKPSPNESHVRSE